jgi:hypothetical protein
MRTKRLKKNGIRSSYFHQSEGDWPHTRVDFSRGGRSTGAGAKEAAEKVGTGQEQQGLKPGNFSSPRFTARLKSCPDTSPVLTRTLQGPRVRAAKETAAEVKEFHGDPERLYLTGMSLGGYGVWEIAKNYPGRFRGHRPGLRRHLLVPTRPAAGIPAVFQVVRSD